MRSKFRMMAAMLVAVFAVGAVTASAASAASETPLFYRAGKELLTTTATMTGGGHSLSVIGIGLATKIECGHDKGTDTLEAGGKSKGTVTFEGCAVVQEKVCKVPNIVIKFVDQLYFIYAEGKLTTKAADLIEPVAGTKVLGTVKVEGCVHATEWKLEGNVAGEVTPINSEGTAVRLVFMESGEKQAIAEVGTRSGGTIIKPNLKANVVPEGKIREMVFIQTEELKLQEKFEVTTLH